MRKLVLFKDLKVARKLASEDTRKLQEERGTEVPERAPFQKKKINLAIRNTGFKNVCSL